MLNYKHVKKFRHRFIYKSIRLQIYNCSCFRLGARNNTTDAGQSGGVGRANNNDTDAQLDARADAGQSGTVGGGNNNDTNAGLKSRAGVGQ